jgi:hypothetical protein
LTVAILAFATVSALARRGRSRCFWSSFLLVGWGYLILTLAPGLDDSTGEFLITRLLLDWLGERLGHQVADPREMPGIWQNLPFAQDSPAYEYLTYLVSGHCLIALVVGIAAGALGSLAYEDREERAGRPVA